ncbi:adhesive plaque matrix protein-like [Eriocheir sinensis]|uniref:adhesive plaque matrix protein-like n=1 Tax=Eriocheir sinensis TaxID=95602 RepID=UPI0021C94389|nr:adhesive plaque matrix protein-like [Eriocheir sinensis]
MAPGVRTVVAAVCMVAACVEAARLPSYPSFAAPPSYSRPAPRAQPDYPTVPPKYSYNYGVADHYSGANFGHSESRNGYKTEGSYTVDLPDGRKQIVTYVDKGDGLEAEVTYEGEAQYPQYKPQPKYKPEPKYKPAPVYRPAASYPKTPVYYT